MSHTITAYINYWINKRTKYSIHSPFVYKLITSGLQQPVDKNKLIKFKRYRRNLVNSKDVISVENLDTDSQVLNTTPKPVKKITGINGNSQAKAKLIFNLSDYFKFNSILVLGSSLGINTLIFKTALPQARITTIESCKNTLAFTRKKLKKANINNIEFIHGTVDEHLLPLLDTQTFDVIYTSKQHTETETLNYFNTIKPLVQNDTLLIFDDIHRSQDMTKIWNKIISDSCVSVSIDLFYLGLVFFKKELSKQHFRL
ncbi:MAG: hypothetical protein CR968_03495 [Flavobacteriia bacterium]|nr:MAG: hypothetical protein CR968_03495 [Flavobacteriia bacterium]